jgi:hypothetical protein
MGYSPDQGDYVVGAALVSKDAMLLVAGENGLANAPGSTSIASSRAAEKESSR